MANYDPALWVAYYNFLRPHRHAGFDVLNKVEMLENAENMPGRWQLLIFLGQQTILNLQKNSRPPNKWSGTVVTGSVEYRSALARGYAAKAP